MANIHRRASDVRAKTLVGFSGQVVEDPRNAEKDFINAAAAVTHKITIPISAADGTDGFTLTLGGRADLSDVAVSLTTTGDANTPALAAAELVDLFNASASRTQFAFASRDGANLILTAPAYGAEWAFTVGTPAGSSGLTVGTVVTVSGADPSAAPYGAAVYAVPSPSSRIGETSGAVVPAAAAALKTKLTVTAADNGKVFRLVVKQGSDKMFVDVTSTNAVGTTATAIGAALTLAGITNAVDTADVTITASKIGESLDVSFFDIVASTVAITIADATSGLKIRQDQLLGVVAYKPTMYDTKLIGTAATGVPAGEEGILLTEGFFLIKMGDSATVAGQSLFIGTSASESGKLFFASSTTRVSWARCVAVSAARDGFTLCRLLPLSA